MTKRLLTSLVCLPLLAFTPVACDDDGGSSGGPSGSGIAIDDLQSELAPVFCERLISCCGSQVPVDQAQCEQLIGGFLAEDVADGKAGMGSGRVVYDGSQAASCKSAIVAADCADLNLSVLPASCDAFLVGTVDDGGACASDLECKSERCDGSDSSTGTEGTCTAVPGVGMACTGDCVEGAWCDNGQCAAQKDTGAACTASSECVSEECSGTSQTCNPPNCGGF